MFQCAAYVLMAIIIMRLKLFMTPHLCIMTSLLASKKVTMSVFTITVSLKDMYYTVYS